MKGPSTAGQVFVLTIIFFTLMLFFSLWLINKGIQPTLMEIAETKTKQFAMRAMNEAVSKRLADDLQYDDLVKIVRDENGKIVSMGWNPLIVNKVLRNATYRVQNYLKRLENGELTFDNENSLDVEAENTGDVETDEVQRHPSIVEIPLGQATNNSLLANLGPRIPVYFQFIGDVQPDIVQNITEYGINAAHFEIYIEMTVNVQVVIPFSTKTTTVKTDVLVFSGVIHGDVPEFYNGSSTGEAPSISIPYSGLP